MLMKSFSHWPYFSEDEIEVVTAVLRSGKVNYWTGEEGRHFEREFAEFAQCKYAVAVANGTVALELALKACGIGAGDEVIVSCYTFIASASAVAVCGAKPVVADVDADTLNITADTIRPLINDRTRAVITVHLVGQACDMDPILALAEEFNLQVIEDCAQAHGATYNGRPVGSLGDVAAFSFCQDKIMTTGGEGGMLTTNSKTIWEFASAYKDHGKNYELAHAPDGTDGFRWLHDSFGTNWRMTEMQAVIGRMHLTKLADWLSRRRENAEILATGFAKIPGLRVTRPRENLEHAYYKFYAFVEMDKLNVGWDRDRIMNAIRAEGIPCFSGICPEIYLEQAFVNAGYAPVERLPIAKACGEASLLFLVHPTLNASQMHETIEAVEKVMGLAVV